MQIYLALLLVVPLATCADDCNSCLNGGGRWCLDVNATNNCQNDNSILAILTSQCSSEVKIGLNCPKLPATGFGYDENFARTIVTPLIAGVYAENPTVCMRNKVPTTVLYQNIRVQCRHGGPNSTCHAYAAYDVSKKVIIVVFEGTSGKQQWMDEISSFFVEKQSFFNNGHVYAYFYNAFDYLWNGGLQTAIMNLKYLYPEFELWAFGHSLGASICTVFASYTVKINLWSPAKVKLVTFGQPRTGDKDFSQWHDNTFLYSYRIVHKQDPVPHIPPMIGPDEVFHHRYEVWYNNDMKVGASYTVCQEADGPYCSNTQMDTVWHDHVIYFDKDITNTWASSGCES